MPRSSVSYEEKSEIVAKYNHRKASEYLHYDAHIKIKNSGKTPVEMRMAFNGIIPGYAPMPPKDHIFRAASIMDLYLKILRWFKKYGYVLV